MDWNPANSALFTGKGTPWGGMDNASPGTPKYETDPNAMPGYDTSPMKKALEQNLREQRARRDQGSRMGLIGANPYGGGQGSSASQVYGRSAAQTEGDINTGYADIEKTAYQEKEAAMKAKNDAMRAEYDAQLKRRQREEDQRNAFNDKASGVLTLGLGG